MSKIDMTNGQTIDQRRNFCKSISKLIFSHIGLVIIVVVWVIIGGTLFQLLEQNQEIEDCQKGRSEENDKIVLLRSKLLDYIQSNITSNPIETGKDNETVANLNIEKWLQEFRNQTIEIRNDYRYTGNDCEQPKWNFPGSLLFAVTAITTIGYGNIAPVTWNGQVVCICYSTIGIPFLLMCVANISGVLGDTFRFVYSRICCHFCQKNKKKTIKHGSNEKSSSNNSSTTVVDENEKLEEERKVTVPLTVTMIIITTYLAIGGVIFNYFEGWTIPESIYFCFITLSTIGFGDFVPGQIAGDKYATLKMLADAIYVFIGMATLAMCFDLMQEEIIAKFTWVGKKLGIVDDKLDPEQSTDEKGRDEIGNEKQASFEDLSREELQNNELLNKFRSKYLENIQKPQ